MLRPRNRIVLEVAGLQIVARRRNDKTRYPGDYRFTSSDSLKDQRNLRGGVDSCGGLGQVTFLCQTGNRHP